MSGNPENASIWGDADVYITDLLEADIPDSIDVDFNGDWDLAGLLDGDAGFEESRSQDSSDFFAWGGLLVRTSRRNFKLQRKFVLLEENAVSLGLVWPGSAPGERRIPKRRKFKAGFETTDGEKKKRVITRNYAEVAEVGTIKDSETDLTKLEITIDIYPDADGVLFDVQPDDASVTLESIAIAPLTLDLSIAGAQIKKITVTATYSDGSTVDVSASAQYSSSVPSGATVDKGYVKGLTAGTRNITAAFRGVEAPAPCVVTVAA